MPSAGRVLPLSTGVSRLSFEGQFGVDFDVFVIADAPQEALLGNWAISGAQQAPNGFSERQHILRVRGQGSFRILIVPFPAGKRPGDLAGRDGQQRRDQAYEEWLRDDARVMSREAHAGVPDR